VAPDPPAHLPAAPRPPCLTHTPVWKTQNIRPNAATVWKVLPVYEKAGHVCTAAALHHLWVNLIWLISIHRYCFLPLEISGSWFLWHSLALSRPVLEHHCTVHLNDFFIREIKISWIFYSIWDTSISEYDQDIMDIF